MKNKLTPREQMLTEFLNVLKFDVLLNTPNKEKCLAYADIKAGDMVMCSTSGAHKWTLARVKEVINGCDFMLEDPITGDLCHMQNESLYLIQGVRASIFYSEEQRIIAGKVRKALALTGDERVMRIEGMTFENGDITLKLRPHIFYDHYVPFEIKIEGVKKSHTIKSIAEKLADKGLEKTWPKDAQVRDENGVNQSL